MKDINKEIETQELITIITKSKFHQRDSTADLSRWKKEQTGQYAHWNYTVWENRKKINDKKIKYGIVSSNKDKETILKVVTHHVQ